MTEQIQVYANSVMSESGHDQSNVLLTGIDPSQVLAEFSVEERLDSIDFGDIVDYISNVKKEQEELDCE